MDPFTDPRRRFEDRAAPGAQPRFDDARWAATVGSLLRTLARQRSTLVPFDELRSRLQHAPAIPRGTHIIPLDAVVGSVERYRDFTAAFLPRSDALRERWQRLDQATVRMENIPPIEVYKLGEVYFVRDGNHRVSVARYNRLANIEANVTEIPVKVPLTPGMSVDQLILAAERSDFLSRTRLDELRPDAAIAFTVPGRYAEALDHIAAHRWYLGEERKAEIGWPDAVVSWYDNVYLPAIAAIEQSGLLARFPSRTAADLYLWTMNHLAELQEVYSTWVDTRMAAADLAREHAGHPAKRAARALKKKAQSWLGREEVPPIVEQLLDKLEAQERAEAEEAEAQERSEAGKVGAQAGGRGGSAMPRYGFNFLWMFIWQPGRQPPPPDERALDFMAEYGFDFVRVPTDYRFWTKHFDYFHPDESVFIAIDRYLDACRARGFQMSLNFHRAPGYCINSNDLERHNLWLDPIAQDAFVFLWESFARRYRGVPGTALSFDLLNEPPGIGQYGLTRENHAALIRRTVAAIRAVDPAREIVIDGLGGGNLAMPELADLGVAHSGRGYQPMSVSHYRAGWWKGSAGLPEPTYPGEYAGQHWDRETLRSFYQPWREVEAAGATVHIGECGCYNKTHNAVALRWLTDLFGLYREFGWGFALWNFAGDFGIVEHGRPGAVYEEIHGYKVDRALLDVILASRVAS